MIAPICAKGQEPDLSVLSEIRDGVLILTINRPEKRNALNPEVWDGIAAGIERAKQLDVSVVIITGAGDAAFSGGTDVEFLRDRSAADVLAGHSQETYDNIERLQKPVIAAINGYAFGGGNELALACDIRLASSNARFGQPEVNIGITPGSGGTQRLVRTIGFGRAKDMLLTGKLIDAEEALRIGLITRICEPGRALEEATVLARELQAKAPMALALVKLSAQAAMTGDQRTGMLLERLSQAFVMTTEDVREGLSAFLEKRNPKYSGH
jgi:enoyl-CoA hydratase